MKRSTAVLGALLLACATAAPRLTEAQDGGKGLTAVEGIKLGHHTLSERPTGCTSSWIASTPSAIA